MDQLDKEIEAKRKKLAEARSRAAELHALADEYEIELRALRRAAMLRPSPVEDQASGQSVAIEADCENRPKGGRQPGSISKQWRHVLAEIADQNDNKPVNEQTIALLARRHGLDIQDSSARERARQYTKRGYLEEVSQGQWRVTITAMKKFKIAGGQNDQDDGDLSPQKETAPMNGAGPALPQERSEGTCEVL